MSVSTDNIISYAILYQLTIYNLPLTKEDGTRLTYEEVLNALDKDTVSYSSGFGIDSAFGELLRMSIKVEANKYDIGIAWLRDTLFQSEFTAERLQVTLAKIQQNLPELKRDGNSVSRSVHSDLIFDKSLTALHGEIISMMEWVPKMTAEIQEDPQSVIDKLVEIRKIRQLTLSCK